MSNWTMPPELPALLNDLTTAKGLDLTVAQLKVAAVFLEVISSLFASEADNMVMPSLTRPSCVTASRHLVEAESHTRQATRGALAAVAIIRKGEPS